MGIYVANTQQSRQAGNTNTHSDKPYAEFSSQRSEAVSQRYLQHTANNSAQLQPLHETKKLVNNSLKGKKSFQLQAMAKSHSAVLQRYPTVDDSGREDAVIYIIYENDGATDGSNIKYVGQTTISREFSRFQEHTRVDSWAPWHIDATPTGLDYTVDRRLWHYDYDVVEVLKNVTKFETTVAEQWWLEHYLTKGAKLLNDSTPCRLSSFNKRRGNASLYDPKNIGVPSNYKPSMTAK